MVEKTKTLAERVVARQKFLEDVVVFSNGIVSVHGKQLSYYQGSSHTNVERELKNFAGFSFYTHGSYTMYGGDEVKVWYHPETEQTPIEPVLHVEYWNIKECKLYVFDQTLNWQEALGKLVSASKAEVEKIEQERREANERKKRAEQEGRDLAEAERNLKKEADRLHLQTEEDAKRLKVA